MQIRVPVCISVLKEIWAENSPMEAIDIVQLVRRQPFTRLSSEMGGCEA